MRAGTRRDISMGQEAAVELLRGKRAPVGGVLASNGPDAWTAFDEEVRRIGRRSYEPLRSKRIEARLCDPDGRVRASALVAWGLPPLKVFLLWHVSWVPLLRRRVRQELRWAAGPPLELVVLRCADWAPPVRGRARRVLGRAVAKDPAGWLVRLTPLILRLSRREHGAWALEQLEAALSGRYSLLAAWWHPGRPSTTWSWNALTAAQRGLILDRLHRSADPLTRRFAARLALEIGGIGGVGGVGGIGGIGVRELAWRAASEPDPAAARLWTDAALRAMADDGPDHAAIDALLDANSPTVRAAGVTALRRAGRAAEAPWYLADRSGLVRACARWLVSQDGGDPSAHYTALVTDAGQVSRYAVTGFSECAERADAPLLRPLLGHPSAGVRAAAVAGLRRLDDATDDALLLPLLDDPSASVSREAARSLIPAVLRLDEGHLAERIAPERPLHVRRAAFRLLCVPGGIRELRAAVTVSKDPDPVLRHAARAIVLDWDWEFTLRTRKAELPELNALLTHSEQVFRPYDLWLRRSRLGLTGCTACGCGCDCAGPGPVSPVEIR
ncbi:HEAT repeat domain-containing protein [Streptomyces sp. AP-93]|uniref:HEAT repeat domain-containing protein n=1 Tax=Streptomyces sp. AP-93 TaxID=2929048 RepID=UPI001FAFBF84|nr:HEAT repeat domain-containing protein [Streptomyces sp. AP-93]MCJ0870475.1 HEAT repeat domain-containing protein [Streptomyces sp. AP-93]